MSGTSRDVRGRIVRENLFHALGTASPEVLIDCVQRTATIREQFEVNSDEYACLTIAMMALNAASLGRF